MEATSMLLITTIIASIIYYIIFKIRRRRLYKLAARFKGPASLPIIGNLLQVSVSPNEIAKKLAEAPLHYKSPSRMWFGPLLAVYLSDPENIKTVLNSPYALTKTNFFKNQLEKITGPGLLTLPADKWKPRRKIISPVFNQKYLEAFLHVFSNNAQKMVNDLWCKVDKGVFNAEEAAVTYSMNTIMEVVFGVEQNFSGGNYIKKWITTALSVAVLRVTKIWYFFDFIFYSTPTGKQFKKDKKEFDVYMKSILEEWENDTVQKAKHSHDPEEEYKQAKFIEQFTSAADGNGKLTTEELKHEIVTLITAGLETTSSTLGYALVTLGMHPDIQEKAYQEIIQVMGTRKELTNDDLKEFEYLDRVIKETLRVFPPAALFVRHATHEIQLEEHIIPADTAVGIGIFTMHRDPSIWPNPTIFNPDRFLPEEESKRHPYSFIPFSGGPRNCVGLRFARMSLKIVLATVLLNYKLTTSYQSVEEVDLTMLVVLKPIKGYNVCITAR